MAERMMHPDVLKTMKELGLEALLSNTTEGLEEEKIVWVTPKEFQDAAEKLISLIKSNDPKVKNIIESYSLNSNNVDPVEQEMIQDLKDVIAISKYVNEKGVTKFTFEVNW
jgi:hypothetical protein